jgi:polyhydroxyalkanoate synthesis repressor PhaR
MTKGLGLVHSTPGAFPAVIKKYSNRRLYNTVTSSYVTLGQLATLARDGTQFVVYDATTGEDITRSVLVQIVAEKESGAGGLLPLAFLRQLITYYGDNLETLVPGYLEHCMLALARSQDQMRQYLQASGGGPDQAERLEEMSRRNLTAFKDMLGEAEKGAKEEGVESPTIQDMDALRNRLGDIEKLLQKLVHAERPRPINDQ